MKKLIITSLALFALLNQAYCNTRIYSNTASPEVAQSQKTRQKTTKIQVAILLDTSGSMDGLIEQAKSRLWNIVNALTTLKYNGKAPQIEIALYEYGGYSIPNRDYVRQVVPLTTDLDLISEKLFALRASGSIENCGTVIDHATRTLEWNNNGADMKLIYIAGNEEFTQGRISYKSAIANALEKDIYVNTIHCGDRATGIRDLWRDAAIRGKGKFFNIDANARVRYIETPYDDDISQCNTRLNNTYIGYGRMAAEKQANQVQQDVNAKSISRANYAERAVSKSKVVYNNSSWDLVDKVKEDRNALADIKQSELPKELQNKSKAEIEKVIAQKESERKTIQNEINELSKKRQAYIEKESKKESGADDLGKAINESLMAFAKTKGYVVE